MIHATTMSSIGFNQFSMVLAKKEAEEREREEERKHREAMGIPSKSYNSIAAALIAAGWDLEG